LNAVTGGFEFSPTANFNGAASFTFIASDGKGVTSAPETVTIDLRDVDNPAAYARQHLAPEYGAGIRPRQQ
jgi:hypothetical protein